MEKINQVLETILFHARTIFEVLRKRAIPILICGALFATIGNQYYQYMDRRYYATAPDSQFIDYYDFSVNNAREGDNVFFKVCRKHDADYAYKGDLSVSIVPNTNNPNENIKVYSRSLSGTLNPGECENKVLPEGDYHHSPGNYVMRFSIEVQTKYGFVKRGGRESNIYTIYPQPNDLNAQIKSLQEEIKRLESQRDSPSGLSLGSGQEATDFVAGAPSPQETNSTSQPSSVGSTGNTETDTQPSGVCAVPLLGGLIGGVTGFCD